MKIFKKSLIAVTVFIAVLLNFQVSQAGENLWVYTKGTDTRPKGSFEFKIGDIARLGKDSGDYSFHDIRPELEYGVTDKLTVGGSIMIFGHNYSVSKTDLDPMYTTQQTQSVTDGGTQKRFNKTQYGGYELSAKYNVLSPYKDFMGLSFKLAYEQKDKYRLDGSDIEQKSYVGVIMLQKDWFDDKLIYAFNWKTELERRKGDEVLEEEIAFDISMGLSYRFKPKHYIGIEFRRQEDHLSPFNTTTNTFEDGVYPSSWDWGDFKLGTRHQYGQYLGPTYHYAEKDWWLTSGILFQTNGGCSNVNPSCTNGRNRDEHETVHVSLQMGYEF